MSYFSYEVTTTTRTVNEMPTLFPQVTICNINQFTTENAYNFLNSLDSEQNISEAGLANLTYADSQGNTGIINYAALSNATSQYFTDQMRKNLAHSLDDIMVSCKFNGKSCSKSDFFWRFDSTKGNCYVFNSGLNSSGQEISLKTASLPESYYGLHLEVYTNFFEPLSTFNSLNGGSGLFVLIDNSSYSRINDGIRVSAGFRTDIVVDRFFKSTMPAPYSNCEIEPDSPKTSTSEIYNLIARSKYEYTQELCFTQCFQKIAISVCNCTDSTLSLYDVPYCVTNEQVFCVIDVFYGIFLSNDFIQNECLPICPLECNKTEYKTSLNTNRLVGDIYAKYIRENERLAADFVSRRVDADTARDSVVSVSIYYDSLSYTVSTESAKMNVVDLLAAIGGNLGLFLGVSLLSVCELIEVLFEIYFIKCRAKNQVLESN